MDIVEAHIFFLIKEQLFEIFESGIYFNVSLRKKAYVKFVTNFNTF